MGPTLENNLGRAHGGLPGLPPTAAGRHAQRRSLGESKLAAAGLGFIAGIAFWHFVGFWGFINEAVYHRHPGEAAQSLPLRTAVLKSQHRQSGSAGPLPPVSEACSDVTIADTADVRIAPCGPAPLKFQPPRGIGRADFADFGSTPEGTLLNTSDPVLSGTASAVGGWAAAIEPVPSKP